MLKKRIVFLATTAILLNNIASSTLAQERTKPTRPEAKADFPGVGSYDSWQSSQPERKAGQALMKEHKWDEAIAHFRASLALYEYQPHVWLAIGRAIEAKSGLIQDAENAYRQSLKLDSQSWSAWKHLANVLYMQKRYAEAREAISNALNLNPPPEARNEMDKIVVRIDSALHDANTTELNQSQ
ncbi:MAG: tetratricopeptide repeat protein [Candidatus Obscuribacterales bacterium]|nr:tetratricopeptide repeat protein [Candidatus Obscuribacterales bacterium]